MNTITLQVPVDKNIKLSAQAAANNMGFSSLQDAVRLFLANLAAGRLSATFSSQEPNEILTPAQEKVLMRKYHQAQKEIARGQYTTAHSAEEFIAQLHGKN